LAPRRGEVFGPKGITIALHWSPSQKDRAEFADENVD
jgi:hypothetical protein